jgi:hypothetical protein
MYFLPLKEVALEAVLSLFTSNVAPYPFAAFGLALSLNSIDPLFQTVWDIHFLSSAARILPAWVLRMALPPQWS